jgi:hypothetical protein
MVYPADDSGALLGIVAFCGQAPASLFSPIAGVLVDRWNRPRDRRRSDRGDAAVGGTLRSSRSPAR